LRLYLNGNLKPDISNNIRSTLKHIGEHCSSTEIAADEAERESVKIKQIEYLAERVGGLYDGIVSGVVKTGIFVKLTGSLVEGMVLFRSIEDDYYEIEEGKHKAKGKRTGKIYRLGDSVKVIVAKVDSENRRADFILVTPPVLPKKVRKKKK
jgi:ribonuclease R